MKRLCRILLIILINVLLFELLLRLIGFTVALPGFAFSKSSFFNSPVYILGESTSADAMGKDSWPAQLRRLVAADKLNIEFVNLAEPGTTTTSLVQNFAQQTRATVPAAVISMMGINDVPGTWYYDAGILKQQNFFTNLRTVKLTRLLFFMTSRSTETDEVRGVQIPLDIQDLLKAGNPENAQTAIESWLYGKGEDYRASFYKSLQFALDEAFPVKRDHLEEAARTYLLFLRPAADVSARVPGLAAQIVFWAAILNEKGLCRHIIDILSRDSAYKLTGHVGHSLTTCLPSDDEKLANFFKKSAPELMPPEKGISVTEKNYQAVYEIVKKENICWVVMQYPRKDVTEMRNYFTPDQLNSGFLKFISNEESFSRNKFDELFRDDFAGVFGHTTEFGSRLLAQSAFAALEPILKNRDCRRNHGPCSECALSN